MKSNADPTARIADPREETQPILPVNDDRPHFERIDRINYPRPLLYRDDYVILNQPWQFDFDDRDEGLEKNWQAPEHALSQTINVPYPYQSKMSGIGDTSVRETCWYKLNMQLPQNWGDAVSLKADKVHIRFAAVDYKSQTFVNGDHAFVNEGGHVHFGFDMTPYLKNDGSSEQIALRVVDKTDAEQPLGKQSRDPYGMFYTATTGIWQPVLVEKVPQVHVQEDGFNVRGSAEDKLFDLTVPIVLSAKVAKVEVEAFDANDPDEAVVAFASARPKGGGANVRLQMPDDAKLYSFAEPNLYNMRVRLKDAEGAVLDEVLTYSGLRDVELKPDGFYFNNTPQFVMATLLQPYWPDSLMAAPSGEAIRDDVAYHKQGGFEGIRMHQSTVMGRFGYWCDVMGVGLFSEMPNPQCLTERAEQCFHSELSRSVDESKGHVSVIAYMPHNESFGCNGLQHGVKHENTHQQRTITIIHSRDNTRPVLFTGWHIDGNVDGYSTHDYSDDEPEYQGHYADYGSGKPLRGLAGTAPFRIMAHGTRYAGQGFMVGESVGWIFNDNEEAGVGYMSVDGIETWKKKYVERIQSVKETPVICGFVVTQYCDVENEKNGLRTYDRKDRIDPAWLKAVHEQILNKQDMEENRVIRLELVQQAEESFYAVPEMRPPVEKQRLTLS